MKRLAYIFVCLVLSISCSSIAEDEIMLLECIDQYEAYDSYNREIFPLGDHTEERYQADYDFYGTLLEKINGIAVAKLTSEDRISLKLLKFLVEDHRANFEFKTHLNPLLSDSGFHNSLVYRVRPLTSKKQSIAYLKMLQAIPIFVDQNLILLKKGIESGVSQPLIIFDGYESSYDKHITETVENNFYFSPFKNLPDQFSSEEKDSLLSVAHATIQKDVIPSFQKIKAFFETEYYKFLKLNKCSALDKIASKLSPAFGSVDLNTNNDLPVKRNLDQIFPPIYLPE